jgi:hypothetical protein
MEPKNVNMIKTIDPVIIPFFAILILSSLEYLSVIATKIGVIPNGLTRAKRVERHNARYCNSILIKLFIYILSGA